jgi:hypothetical protein
LGFLQCGLQYRYPCIGKLPSTRPVQAWFGQFIHGVLEEVYRRYEVSRQEETLQLPPLLEETITDICDLIQTRLAAQQLFPWGEDLEVLGRLRARVAINELGRELFPLIAKAEVRLTGARPLPLEQIPTQYRFREANRYEVQGVAEAEVALETFAAKWDEQYPAISQIWYRHWDNIIPLFDYPMDIRKAILVPTYFVSASLGKGLLPFNDEAISR